MLASSFTPTPHHWVSTVYPRSTASIGRVELNSNQDASTLAVTLGAATALAYMSVHVITIMRWNNSLARLFGNCSLQLLALLVVVDL